MPTTASQTAPQHAKQEYQDTLREFEKKVDKLKTENIKFADERIQNINPGNIDANLTGKSQRQDCSHHAFRSQYGQDEFFICVHVWNFKFDFGLIPQIVLMKSNVSRYHTFC